MRTIVKACTFAAIVGLSISAQAYNETITHPTLTDAAVAQSALARDPTLLVDLGLKRFSDPNQKFGGLSITGNFIVGVIDEDQGRRALNHFYDPQFDRPLSVVIRLGETSPDWTLEDRGTFDAQLDSYRDARDSMYNALTFNDPAQSGLFNAQARSQYWQLTFRRLGHVVHHMQDMAQPQHVRNDAHCDLGFFACRGFYNPSRYEAYTATEAAERVFNIANGQPIAPVFPGAAELKTPRHFWINTAGSGISQFTNRNFVSQGTNFTVSIFGNVSAARYPFPQPGTPVDYSIDQLFQDQGLTTPPGITALCSSIGVDCRMTMYPTPLTSKASTLSIFDQDVQNYGAGVTYDDGVTQPVYTVSRIFALNRFNFDAVYGTLIPKAVSYSAGMINYFFRGRLQVSLPDEKVYSVVDQSTVLQTDPLNGFNGFDTIKLNLANVTPGAEEMSAGKVVALARFHRNGCYKDDLSGEFTPSLVPPCPFFRTNDEEVLVSNEVPGRSVGRSPTPFTFTFPRAIPINATDLFIQVVYRGALGDETDAVAAVTKDIFEPTHFAIFNSTDRILFNGTFFDTADPALLPTLDQNRDGVIDAAFDRTNLDVFFGFTDAFGTTPLATVQQLPPGRYSRVTLLTDRSPFPAPIEAIGRGFFSASVATFGAETFQLDTDAGVFFVPVLEPMRGVPSFDSFTLFKVVGTPTTGDLSTLPPLTNQAPFPLTTLTFKPPAP